MRAGFPFGILLLNQYFNTKQILEKYFVPVVAGFFWGVGFFFFSTKMSLAVLVEEHSNSYSPLKKPQVPL